LTLPVFEDANFLPGAEERVTKGTEMKIKVIALLAVAAIPGALVQANSPDAAERWFAHVRFLAGDELVGRKTGTTEFTKPEEYVQEQFKEAGLGPACAHGYLQDVGFVTVQLDTSRRTT
jgi:hypothetical protein